MVANASDALCTLLVLREKKCFSDRSKTAAVCDESRKFLCFSYQVKHALIL